MPRCAWRASRRSTATSRSTPPCTPTSRRSTPARATRCSPIIRCPIRCSSGSCRPAAGQARCPRSCASRSASACRSARRWPQARAELEQAVAAATDDAGPPVEIVWSGGQFAPCEIAVDDRWVTLVRDGGHGRARRPAAARRRRLRDRHAPVPRARHPVPHVRPARHPARARRRRARRDRRPGRPSRA